MSTGDEVDLLVRTEDELQEYTIESQILTLKEAQLNQLNEHVSLFIDDDKESFKFPRAVIARDAYGNELRDKNGAPVVRYSTVYDAVDKYYVDLKKKSKNPIPILCHQQHLEPVAMCRVCMVLVAGPEIKEGKIQYDDNKKIKYGKESLVPACHRIIDENMKIFTPRHPSEDKSKKISRLSGLLLELLMSDHGNRNAHNELANLSAEERRLRPEFYQLVRDNGVQTSPRFPPPSPVVSRPKDNSSYFIDVDHASCILCDRCIRSCTDVKRNKIIGRTESGYKTRISFDLDQPMGSSDCVECGECAANCPTDALTFKKIIEPDWD